jgi:hypothetical protein
MGTLREKLKAEIPELYDALMRSWDIANIRWLPAIPISKGSYSSYPHLYSLESHLEEVLHSVNQDYPGRIDLNPIEIYLILSAILFHDTGKILEYVAEEKKVKQKSVLSLDEFEWNHAEGSFLFIQDHWGDCGIFSREFAEIISRICLFHDPPKNLKNEKDHETRLRTERIIPYGSINEEKLGVLLTLIDQMGNEYLRAKPEFLPSNAINDIKAVFRQHIKSVSYAPFAQMIEISLGKMIPGFLKEKTDGFSCDLFKYLNIGPYSNNQSETIKIIENNEKYLSIQQGEWPIADVTILIMKSTFNMYKSLDRIRIELSKYGVPVKGCRIGYNDLLFDHRGQMNYEPIFYEKYLDDILKSMWELSTRVFGPSEFSYATLASESREMDINKVKLAVRRISAICNYKSMKTGQLQPIIAGDGSWRWNIHRQEKESGDVLCNFIDYKEIQKVLHDISHSSMES